MTELVKIDMTHTRLMKIWYDLGNYCNYNCWYCFPGANENTVPFPDPDIVKVNMVALVNHYINSGVVDEVELHLLGGEPTLWKHLGDVTQYINDNTKQCHVEITTNGSRTLRWWREYGHYFRNISISVHHESCDVDHLIKVADILYEKDVMFHTNVLMDFKAWDKCMDIYNKLMATETQFVVLVKPIHIDGDTTHYTDEQREFLKTNIKRWPPADKMPMYDTLARRTYYATYDDGSTIETDNVNYFILNHQNHFKGWECSLGQNWLNINRDGIVSGSCKHLLYDMPFHYNINDINFHKIFKPKKMIPIICQSDVCQCSGEAALPKRKL